MNDAQELQLFPPIEPYRTGMLPVDELHTLYWEESGNPDGMPVVYLHGGPGGGASPEKRQWFDPGVYRIVLFDQRAAFRSTPLGETRGNTTQLLVQDIEVLRGIFFGSPREIDWFINGMGRFYPNAHDDFISWIPEQERADKLAAYGKKLFGDDHAVQMAFARRWYAYSEGRHDVIAPPEAAYRLHHAWPGSVLHMVANAGHAPSEPGIRQRLLQAIGHYSRERRLS